MLQKKPVNRWMKLIEIFSFREMQSTAEFQSKTLEKLPYLNFAILAILFIATLFPQRAGINRPAIYLLLGLALTVAFFIKFFAGGRGKVKLIFLITLASSFWTAALIGFSGGSQSYFYPLYYLIVFLAGAFYQPILLISVVFSVILSDTSVSIVTSLGLNELLKVAVRTPIYFATAFTSYFLVRKILYAMDKEKETRYLLDLAKQREVRLMTLFEISKKIGAILRLDHVLEIVVADVKKILEVDLCLVYLLKEHVPEAKSMVSTEPITTLSQYTLGKEGGEWVVENPKVLNVSEIKKDSRFTHLEDKIDYASVLAVPLIVGARVIGVLMCASEKRRDFSRDDVNFLSTLGFQAAIAIENARLYQETQELTVTDSLTGLYNIRRFNEQIAQEIMRAERYERSVSLLFIDVDNFKQYNDANGHISGDIVLHKIASVLKKSSRAADQVYRYGGEEFCVIIPETTKGYALTIAGRLRTLIEETQFDGEEKQPTGKITVSIGVASYPNDAQDAETLVDRADKAMYEAKRAGRNKVYSFKPVKVS